VAYDGHSVVPVRLRQQLDVPLDVLGVGLDASTPYVVFDYWNQRLLGVFKDRIDVEIKPHDTRVLHIHALLARPQLIGSSRHITGAYSILDLKWDAATSILRGSSQTVPGDTYTLFVHAPDGVAAAKVAATAAGIGVVPTLQDRAGNCLAIPFTGQQEPIKWQGTFSSGAR
jgi:hypothetical protein